MVNNTEAPEKDIVSFDQALELCSLGFDEPTFCMYEIENKQLCLCYLDEEGLYMPQKDFHAPTKSQVFRWFREKYDLYSYIFPWIRRVGWGYDIPNESSAVKQTNDNTFTSYEEAENACIDKLISLCKQQDNG